MPPASRRRDAAASRIMKVLGDDTNVNSSGSNNSSSDTKAKQALQPEQEWTRDHLSLVLQDLEESLNDRLSLLASETSKAKDAQKQVHVKSMVKIRKQVRGMSVRQFNETYGCDLLQLLKMPTSSSANKKRIRPEALATPAPSRQGKAVPMTASRTVKRGEAIYSKNGSPVDKVDEGSLVATVTKKRRKDNSTDGTAANFDINVGEGRYISLSNPGNVEALDEELKSTAIEQLQVLQDQMASLMAQLKN